MKKFIVPAALLSAAAIFAACSSDTLSGPTNAPVVHSTIGVAEVAQIQVCVAGPAGPTYSVDVSLTNTKVTDVTVTGNGLAISAGSCIVVDQKNIAVEAPDIPQYCLKPADQNPALSIYCPTIATSTAHSSVAGTWTYSCVSPAVFFCPGTGTYDAFTPAPTGSGSSAVTKGNPQHGSTITFTFTPSQTTGPGCTITRGFVLNQLNWLTNGIGPDITVTINGTTLTKAQIKAALDAPTRGDQLVQLKAQLITALAAISIGATTNATVDAAITNAQAYLLGGATKKQITDAIDILTTFNEGNAGGGASKHCTDAQEKILKS
jgi:hypothetical protein